MRTFDLARTCLRRRAARRRALCGRRGYDVSCTTSTGRSSTPSRGTPRTRGGGDRDGQHIISGSQDRHVKVWSVATKSLVGDCIGPIARAAVAVMPDGKRILSGSNDKTVRRWLLDGTQTDTFRLHPPRCAPSWRCPTTSTPSPARTTGPSSSSTPTTAVLRTCANGPGDVPRAAARRPPLRQRRGRPHRLHRRAWPRATLKIGRDF